MYGFNILWEIPKVPFEISHKILNQYAAKYDILKDDILKELKWSGGWGTGTVGWLSASEWGQYLEVWNAMNTKCLVTLPFQPDLILWSIDSHGSSVLVPPETQQSGSDGVELDWLC